MMVHVFLFCHCMVVTQCLIGAVDLLWGYCSVFAVYLSRLRTTQPRKVTLGRRFLGLCGFQHSVFVGTPTYQISFLCTQVTAQRSLSFLNCSLHSRSKNSARPRQAKLAGRGAGPTSGAGCQVAGSDSPELAGSAGFCLLAS
jgi:hypothetical protein